MNCHTVFHSSCVFYIPTKRAQVFQFLHILTNTCYFLFFLCVCFVLCDSSHPNWCEVVSPWALVCISLMISDIEHLFMWLLVICISSLAKYLFKSSAHLKIMLLVFLLFSCRSSSYNLDTNLSSDIWFANIFNIFSHSKGCIFTLLIIYFDAVFYFDLVQFIYFYFCYLCFWCHIWETTAKSNVMKLLSYVFF